MEFLHAVDNVFPQVDTDRWEKALNTDGLSQLLRESFLFVDKRNDAVDMPTNPSASSFAGFVGDWTKIPIGISVQSQQERRRMLLSTTTTGSDHSTLDAFLASLACFSSSVSWSRAVAALSMITVASSSEISKISESSFGSSS